MATYTYNSLSKIKQDFQIDTDDLEVIRERLSDLRVTFHPDKTNGEFQNESVKEKFLNVSSAIDYIDSIKNNHSLVVVEKMADLMKIVAGFIPNNTQNSLEQKLDSKISNAILTFRSPLFLPRISLTVITSVVTFIFLFPGQIKDNPTLSQYLDPTNKWFGLLWLTLLAYTGVFWVMAYLNEEKSKKKLGFLKVDSTQNQLFDDFIYFKFSLNPSANNEFTKDELTHFIYQDSLGRGSHLWKKRRLSPFEVINSKLFGSEIITTEIAQNIAELIIARADKNNVIKKVDRYSLSDTYETQIPAKVLRPE